MQPQIVAEPAKWLGETFGFWIQTGMLAASAVAGIWIVFARGKQEARRAVVEVVIEQKRDQNLNDAREVIKKLHETGETNLARFLQNIESVEYKAILLSLNTYEFMAVGIRRKAFDGQVFKLMRYSTLIRDWDAFEGFIKELRRMREAPTAFQEFEWLAARWKKKPLKKN